MSAELLLQIEKTAQEAERHRATSVDSMIPVVRKLAALVQEADSAAKNEANYKIARLLTQRAQKSAEWLLLNANALLFHDGLLERVYDVVPDPILLSGVIHRGFSHYEPQYDLAREALRIGGVWFTNDSKLGDDIAERTTTVPPVDLCKAALEAFVEQSWAYDRSKFDSYAQQRLITGLMAACVKDGEAEFVIDFIQEDSEGLLNTFALNSVLKEDPEVVQALSIFTASHSIDFLTTLAEKSPDLYVKLGRTKLFQNHLFAKVTEGEGVTLDLAKLPPSEFLDVQFLVGCMSGLTSDDRLTPAKFEMLEQTWHKQGLPSSVEQETLARGVLDLEMRNLRLYRHALAVEKDVSEIWAIRHTDYAPMKSFAFLESLYSKKDRFQDDPVCRERHIAAYISTHGELPREAAGAKIEVSELILGACLLETHRVYKKSQKQNQDLVGLISQTFEDKTKRHYLSGLSKERLDELRVYVPSITDGMVKAMNWKDPRIHGGVFTNELNV